MERFPGPGGEKEEAMAKILAVDDDKAILTMIRRILEKDGHRVTVYADSGAVEQMELSEIGRASCRERV